MSNGWIAVDLHVVGVGVAGVEAGEGVQAAEQEGRGGGAEST